VSKSQSKNDIAYESFLARSILSNVGAFLGYQNNFDHSIHGFVASFVNDHLDFHKTSLAKAAAEAYKAACRDDISPLASNFLEEFATTQGQTIECKAAVAWAAKEGWSAIFVCRM